MGLILEFLWTKLGIMSAGAALLLLVGTASQCRDSRRVRQIDRLKANMEAVGRERDIYRNQALGYKAVADSSWKAVGVLGESVDEVKRLSDSLLIRSRLDASRARRQALDAETALMNLREAMARDTTLQSCEDLFPSSSAVWY